MATSAFKSTSRRSTLLPSTTTTTHRRTRSLSRHPKGKFVNTTRGSDFADVSLDDLALELFSSSSALDTSNDEANAREGRSARRGGAGVGRWAEDTASSSQRRGRSVSRHNKNDVISSYNNNNNNSSSSRNNVDNKVEQSSTRRRRSVSVVRKKISDSEGLSGCGSGGGKSSSLNNSGGKVAQISSRRRRSLSVAHNQISDSESDRDLSLSYGRNGKLKDLVGGRNQMSSSVQRAAPNGWRLDRSLSLKDLSLSNDGYSSQSSVLTDEEPRCARQDKFGTEKTIRTVYAQKKGAHPTDEGSSGLSEAMRKEIRHAVEGIRTELEQAVARTNTSKEVEEDEIHQSLSEVKQKYAAKSKQEQQGKLVKEIVTVSKNASTPQGPAQTRKMFNSSSIPLSSCFVCFFICLSCLLHHFMIEVKQLSDSCSFILFLQLSQRSNDRTGMSSSLVEEAEKYFVDFISNVEDTDISSFDGDRSDGSSSLGCTSRARGGTNYTEAENFQSPAVPLGTDGVILPWLQWESSNDASPSRKSSTQTPATPTALKFDAEEEMNFIQDPSYHSVSSRGSSRSNLFSSHPIITTKKDGVNITGTSNRSQFDMDEYLHLQKKEDHLFEIYKERRRISCGGLLLCAGGL